MWFPILSALWRSRSGRRTTRRKPASARLCVEALEDRTVPALFTAASVSDLIADINAANTNAEADTIVLAPGATFSLTAVSDVTHGPTGLPVIKTDLTIVGNSATIERSTAAGTPAFRLLEVAAGGSLTAQNLTLQGGLAWGWGESAYGGGIFNQGTLTLDGVVLMNNTAKGRDAEPFGGWGFNPPGGTALGGGVYSTGSLVVKDSTLQTNTAIGGKGGGAFWYSPYSDDVASRYRYRVPASDGGSGFGGGVYIAAGTATFTHSLVSTCTAKGGTGGGGANNGQGVGGGIYIAPAATAFLDPYTLEHLKQNKASTSDPNLFGSYVLI